MKITLLSLVLCLLCSLNMAAQGSDIGSNPEDTTIHQLSKKELRRRKVAKRNIHYNILGGPSYTPDGKTVLSVINEDDLEKLFK